LALWNFSSVVLQNFTVPEDFFGAKEDPEAWAAFRETLVANEAFKVDQVTTTRIGFQEKKKPE
jgi:hypothetical protein